MQVDNNPYSFLASSKQDVFISGKMKVWENLNMLSQTREKIRIAVGYFSDANLIKWKKGDQLILDLNDDAVRNRAISPLAIQELLDNKVEVFHLPNLHSKVYYFGDCAFIGSANISRHSAYTLDEAGIITYQNDLIKSIDAYLDDSIKIAKKLCLSDLEKYKPIYDERNVEVQSNLPEPFQIPKIWIVPFVNLQNNNVSDLIKSENNLDCYLIDANKEFIQAIVYEHGYEQLQMNDLVLLFKKDDLQGPWISQLLRALPIKWKNDKKWIRVRCPNDLIKIPFIKLPENIKKLVLDNENMELIDGKQELLNFYDEYSLP
jgi:hypothetical protein